MTPDPTSAANEVSLSGQQVISAQESARAQKQKRGRGMDFATLIMFVAAGVLMFMAFQRGSDVLVDGLMSGGRTLWSIMPLLIAAFIVAGMAEQLLPRETIASWIGNQSGWRGIFIAAGIGAITPGGPFVSYPLVAVLYKAGAGIGPLVAFVTAWSLWAVSRLPLELAFVGPRLTIIRLLSTLIFPPLAGWIAQVLFSRYA
jgi:hypothetical protein